MAIDSKIIKRNQSPLLKEKKQLESLLSRIAKKDLRGGDYHASYPEFGSKEDENAAEVAAFEVSLAEEHDLEQRLKNVEAALARVAAGTYGICTVGGEKIPKERLAAVPEAETCIRHAKP